MTTLSDALIQAQRYWEAKGPSSRMMPIRARACADALPKSQRLELLGPSEATKVLTRLHQTKSKGSVPVYYAAFKRAVELAGGDTRGWPSAGSAPRKCREPLSEEDLDRLAEALKGYSGTYSKEHWSPSRYDIIRETPTAYLLRCGGWETYDLLELLRGTGLRVEREALSSTSLDWIPDKRLLKVKGKGDHERIIPVERPQTIELLNSPGRLQKMRRLSYSGHLKRWQVAIARLRLTSMKPTPHAVRHYYATRAYARSGRDLRLVQELLGHADISTTARYLGVNPEELRKAVS
jgi:integrase